MKKFLFALVTALALLASTTVHADRQYYYCDPQKSKFCAGLVAVYEFDEGSNYARTSETGSSRFLEPAGQNVGNTSGLLGANGGAAYAFNHTAAGNSYLEIPNTVGFSGMFTINLWIRVNTAPSASKFSDILYVYNASGSSPYHYDPRLQMVYDTGTTVKFKLLAKQSVTDTETPVTSAAVTYGTSWHLVSFGMYPSPTTTEPYQTTLWIATDGGSKQTATITWPSVPATGNLRIGEDYAGGNEEYGAYTVDQMSVYSWIFSAADLTAFYNSGSGRQFPFTYLGY